MKKLLKSMSVVTVAAVLLAGLMALVVRRIDIQNQIVYDGFGRELSEPPLWARFLITDEKVWAGAGWHAVDFIWFVGGLYLAYWLYSKAGE